MYINNDVDASRNTLFVVLEVDPCTRKEQLTTSSNIHRAKRAKRAKKAKEGKRGRRG